jgi:hypothetical protein
MADQQMMEAPAGETMTAPAPAPPEAETEKAKGRRAKRAKKEKPPKAAKAPKAPKAQKAQKAPREPRARNGKGAGASALLAAVVDEGPSREQLEREAAAELQAALAPSYDLLLGSVPGASSPEEAQRAIEAKLGPPVPDRDPGIPEHVQWTGDALVYQQLRRHYGDPDPGGSFRRSWFPGGDSGVPPMLGG